MAYQVQISANMLTWPKMCVCCCSAEVTGKLRTSASRTRGVRVKRTTTSSWDVPYCSRCLAHIDAYSAARLWVYIGLVSSLGLWWIVTAKFGNDAGIWSACGLMVVSLCLFAYARARATEEMAESCCNVTASVRYLAWYGTFQTFVFSSKAYLDLFLAANSRKHRSDVVEVSDSLLRSGSKAGGSIAGIGLVIIVILAIAANDKKSDDSTNSAATITQSQSQTPDHSSNAPRKKAPKAARAAELAPVASQPPEDPEQPSMDSAGNSSGAVQQPTHEDIVNRCLNDLAATGRYNDETGHRYMVNACNTMAK
jgi:hypothetical protein